VLTAVEFFSGIGGFAEAAHQANIEIVQSFDQDEAANFVYEHNFKAKPNTRNLDSIRFDHIAPADLWWLSPPCTPYTVRGLQRDLKDPRSQSLVNLISLIPDALPEFVVVENVLGFKGSEAEQMLVGTLRNCKYAISDFALCPSQLGKPAKRPRYFLIGSKDQIEPEDISKSNRQTLNDYLMEGVIDHLILEPHVVRRYSEAMNIIDIQETLLSTTSSICFTSNYGKCLRGSGSFLQLSDSEVRRFAPAEILNLLGFRKSFTIPESISLSKQWKLVGNSLDIDCVNQILRVILLK
jgi:DNA (cytosine-5)-methyltransferase 1